MVIDAHNHIGIEWVNYVSGDHPYAQSLEDLIIKARSTPVSHWIAFPFVSYTGATLPVTPTVDGFGSNAPYELANLRLLEEIAEYSGNGRREVLPFVMVDPEREVDRQVEWYPYS